MVLWKISLDCGHGTLEAASEKASISWVEFRGQRRDALGFG